MNQSQAPAGQARRQILTFRIAGEWYALDVARVQRVEPCVSLTPVPGAPPAILGVFSSHGELVAALDPRPILGLPAAEAAPAFVVIAREGELSGGVLVDWVDEVTAVPIEAVEPPAVGAACAAGQVRLRDRLVSLLNLGALFGAVAGE